MNILSKSGLRHSISLHHRHQRSSLLEEVLLASDLSLMGVHREKMSLSVEHPPVQIHLERGLNVTIIFYVLLFGLSLNLISRQFFGISGYLMSIGKEQIKVFEGLPQEERLHHVPGSRVQRVSHLGRKKAHKDWEL